jgi:predicted NACHT family NTPase
MPIFPNATDAEQRIKRVAIALGNSSPLRALAGNLLLLTMIVFIAQDQKLPRERVQLYKQVLDVLMFDWERIDKDDLQSSQILREFQDRDSKPDLLRWIAWSMSQHEQCLASNVISRQDLEQTIRDHPEGKRCFQATALSSVAAG